MVSSERFSAELEAQMERAAVRGQKHIVINELELHVALGVFPRPNHHTAAGVMEYERKSGDVLACREGQCNGADYSLSFAESSKPFGKVRSVTSWVTRLRSESCGNLLTASRTKTERRDVAADTVILRV